MKRLAPNATTQGGGSRSDASKSTAAPVRYGRLDGLRAVWVVGVMAHHLEFTFTGFGPAIFVGGWLPVDGFFVLSGFLLGGALVGEQERDGRIHYGRFILRRLGRLYPALVAMIVGVAAFALIVDHQPLGLVWPAVLGPGLYVYNLFYSTHLPLLSDAGHLWSLSVEFQFYLLLPLLVAGLSWVRASRVMWVVTVASLGVASAVARHVLGSSHLPETYLDLPFRLDSLMYGVLAALLVRWNWIGPRNRTLFRILGPIAAAVLAYLYLTQGGFDHQTYSWGIAVSSVASTVVVLWIFIDPLGRVSRFLGSRPMAAAGARSYSAYLWHFPIFMILARHAPRLGAWPRSILALTATAVAACISYSLIERPFIRLSSRWRSVGPRFGAADADPAAN